MFTERLPKATVKLPQGIRIALAISVDFEAEEDATFLSPTQPDYLDFHERQYDGRRGVWRLLEVLGKHKVFTTFFICGAVLENYPAASKQVKACGHEVAGHTYHHEHFDRMTATEENNAFVRMLAAFEKLYGERPVGFRTCFPSVRTLDFVAECGFRYDSTLRNDDIPHILQREDGKFFVEIPRGFNGDAPLVGTPVATVLATGKYGIPADVASHWKREFDWRYQRGAIEAQVMSLCLHPFISGRPSRAKALDEFLAHTKQFSHVWFATHAQLADWWLSQE